MILWCHTQPRQWCCYGLVCICQLIPRLILLTSEDKALCCCSSACHFELRRSLGLMSSAEFLWVSGEWGQALRSVGCVGRARHGNMYNHADERDWAAVIEPHLSCGWKCCFGLNLDFKNAVKNRATEKRPCELKSHLLCEYRLAFGNLYIFMLHKLVVLRNSSLMYATK